MKPSTLNQCDPISPDPLIIESGTLHGGFMAKCSPYADSGALGGSMEINPMNINTGKSADSFTKIPLPDESGTVLWHSEAGFSAPDRLLFADDTWSADAALKSMRAGSALVWRGDFQNARQLLQALTRRLDKKAKSPASTHTLSLTERFHRYRMQQAQRVRLLGQLLIQIEADNGIALRRAPEVGQAMSQVFAPRQLPMLISLRELLGIIGAYEWRRKGVPIANCDFRIHPHYGVFSPSRAEYLDLVMQAPLPGRHHCAFDIGTGTGVLAILLAKKGVNQVIATDSSPLAVACAQENVQRLGLEHCVRVQKQAFFPDGKADLLICNPPWLPGKVVTSLDAAVYDPDEQMLEGFLQEARAHLEPDGQIWLIMSDLAELLGLRAEGALQARFELAGLQVHATYDARPGHRRATDRSDPLYEARARETTRLWCLVPTDTENS